MTKATEKFENLSVKELKDVIKDTFEEKGKTLPAGMWKMNKNELISELEEIYIDFADESENQETEEKTEAEEAAKEEKETKVKPAKSKESKAKRGARTKKVKMINHGNDETIIFDKADDAHKWLKANHSLGYSHIKQSAEGKQTKKLEALNITFEWLKED